MSNCEHDFDIIVLTETWAKDESQTLCHIPGYNAAHNHRENRKGGGVSIFVKESINFSVTEDSKLSSDCIESVAINFQMKL